MKIRNIIIVLICIVGFFACGFQIYESNYSGGREGAIIQSYMNHCVHSINTLQKTYHINGKHLPADCEDGRPIPVGFGTMANGDYSKSYTSHILANEDGSFTISFSSIYGAFALWDGQRFCFTQKSAQTC